MKQPFNPAQSGGFGGQANAHFAPFLGDVIDNMGIGLWDWDLQKNSFVFSAQWEAIAGYEDGELSKTVESWKRCILPADFAQAEMEIEDYVNGKTSAYEAEFRLVRKDKSIIWVQNRGAIAQWDKNGKPTRFIGVLQDISRIKATEKALKEKSEQLDFVAKISGLGMWDWDMRNDTITYNADYLDMMGYSQKDILCSNDEWKSFSHPDDLPILEKALEEYLCGNAEKYAVETRMRHKNGNYIWMIDTGRIVEWDEEGKPARMLGGQLNIDGIKRAELSAQQSLEENSKFNQRLQTDIQQTVAKLKETEVFSRTMFEASPYIASIFDDQMQLMDCNPMAVEYFGFKDKEDLLKNMLPFIKQSVPLVQPGGLPSPTLIHCFKTAVENGSLDLNVELVLHGKNVPMRIIFKKVPYKSSFAIVVYMLDLSALRQAKDELLHQDQILLVLNSVSSNLMAASTDVFDEVVRESMGEIALAVGADRMYIWQNAEIEAKHCCQKIYDWNAGDAFGEHLVQGQNQHNIAEYSKMEVLHNFLSQGKTINTLVENTTDEVRLGLSAQNIKAILVLPISIKNVFWGFIGFDNCKSARVFSSTEVKMLESGGITLVTAILRNLLTKNLILAKEDALASTRAKSDFLSRMSHEIRTPMNAIIGMNTLARKARDYNRIQFCLGKIDSASNQLLHIINDILDMSKIESGKFEMESPEFNFEAMMQGVLDVIQLRVEQNSQHFTVEFESMFKNMMICDQLRISQITTNLLSNASKFTPPGGEISLKISHRENTEKTPILRVQVKDSGIGISKEHQEKLFHSFEQADGGITRRYGGTGLGLALSQRVLSMMGGHIEVESQPGSGSTFTFEVPFKWGRELKNAEAKNNIPKDLRILVVDDSEGARAYFSSLLAGFSLSCKTAQSGEVATEMARQAQKENQPYHIVFIDWMMPRMSGADTAKKIKELCKNKTHVVMISAAEWSEIEPEVENLGVTEYLSKPVLPTMLFNTILRLSGAQPFAQDEPENEKMHSWADKNILLVEDLAINREIIYGILEETQLAIDTAENGRIGVEMYLKNPQKYQLVLMDMQMPELDGLAATREIRASNAPGCKNVPIVAMTANAFKEDVENCLAAGMNGHIAKPVDVDVLIKTLKQYLG